VQDGEAGITWCWFTKEWW